MSIERLLCEGILLSAVGVAGLLFRKKKPQEESGPEIRPMPEVLNAKQREELDAIRLRHQVRLMTPEEEGFSIERLPEGIFGFTYAPNLPDTPLFRAYAMYSFEVHKLAGGSTALLGYVAEQEHAAIEQGSEHIEVRLYPEPYGQATRLVAVPSSRIVRSKERPSREDGNYFTMTVGPRE